MKLKLLIPIFVMIFLAAAVNAFVVSGTVTDTDTNPINGANINVYDSSSTLTNSTTTNATGDYSLEVGNLLRIVNCSATGFDTQSSPVFVSADTTVDFALGPIQSVTLAGYVRDNSSTPLNNVNIVVIQGGATFAQTTTDALGYYSVNVIDGDSYDVVASLATYDSAASSVIISGNTALDFTLSQTLTCTDNDGDGYGDGCALGPDFNDNDADQYPGAPCTRTCYSGSTYDATGVCTGGTYTCSSGGGGGSSSSYSGTDYEIDLDEGEIIIKELRRRDTVTFEYEGESHTVTINTVYTSSVSVTVASSPVTESISLLQKKGFNLNNDLANDFYITLNEISGSIAKLQFELAEPLIIPDIPVVSTPQPKYTDTPKKGNPVTIIVEDEDITVDEEEDESRKSVFAYIGGFFKNALNKILYLKYVVAGVILLAVLILIISIATRLKSAKRTSGRSRKKEQVIERIKELESQLKDLKNSV